MKKWVCTIIQDENHKYRAIMLINNQNVDDLPSEVDYKTLREAIRKKTGIEILKKRDMFFDRLSHFERIATIDNTQYREDCRVRIEERKNGWTPCWDL